MTQTAVFVQPADAAACADALQAFIDANPNRTIEIPDGGNLPDANWWTGESFVIPGYGHAERIYIPWRSMGHQAPPARVGFTISLQDDDNGGEREHTLYWQGNPAKPHLDERAFGVVSFEQ